MKTLLVPIDFSDVSANTLQYVADFASDACATRVILLRTDYVSIYAGMVPHADVDYVENDRLDTEARLASLRGLLRGKCTPSIAIQLAESDLPILRAVHAAIDSCEADVVIVAYDANAAEGSPGAEAIAIARTSPVPVLVIPAGVTYQPFRRALVPCDFAAVPGITQLRGLSNLGTWLHPALVVLHIDPRGLHAGQEAVHDARLRESCGKGYSYEIHYTEDRDIVRGILDFAQAQDLQLIIALPGQHSFFYHLTHRSITEALARNARYPVLILKSA